MSKKTIPLLTSLSAQYNLDKLLKYNLSFEDFDIIKKRVSKQKSALKVAIAKSFNIGDNVEYRVDYSLCYSLNEATFKGVVTGKNKGMSVPIIIVDVIEEHKDGTTKIHSCGDKISVTHMNIGSQYSLKGTSLIKI